MKVILLLVVFLASSVTSFKPPSFDSPSVVKITAAEAYCDEFHGIPCTDCRESVFHPCCPWWEPEKCPPAIKAKVRDGARAASRYYGEAVNFFALAAVPICASTAVALPMLAPCVGVGASGAYAAIMKGIYDQIGDAASRVIYGDYPYWLPYDLWIPTAAELGLQYTGNANVDNMIDAVRVSYGYMLFVVESADRVRYCYYDPDTNCAGWQQERVDEGLRQLSNWIYYSAVNLNGMAAEIADSGADLQGIPVVQVIYDEATVANWAAGQVQP